MKPIILCAAVVCLASESPRFERNSVTPNHSGLLPFSMNIQYIPQPVHLTMSNVTLKFCLQQAYGLTEHQVFGPGWIKNARYDVNATLPEGGQPQQVRPALQAVLDEHFRLSPRRETKVMPIYALIVAKGGPKLHPSEDHVEKAGKSKADEGFSGTLDLRRVSMKEFCENLSRRTDRLVIDETGISGKFDIALNYQQSSDRSGLSMFNAVQRQLGLKLEPRSKLVDVLTVQSAKR